MKKLEKIIMISSLVIGVSLFSFGIYKNSTALKIPGLIIGAAGVGIALRPLTEYDDPKKQK
jgi:hypothetical protein